MTIYSCFQQVVKMSLMGSVVIVAVLLIRMLLKKAPKIYSYALWGIVLFRLLCPFSFSSNYSFFNLVDVVEKKSPVAIVEIEPDFTFNDEEVLSALPSIPDESNSHPVSITNQTYRSIGGMVWLLGMGIFGVKLGLDTLYLKKKLVSKVCIQNNIYLCDDIDTSFVLGIIRPKIYLPSCLEDKEKDYILWHEKIHIQRFDPLIKALAIFALMLHWFNPLVWVAFYCLEKDMEMSCDEAVIKKLGETIKKEYASSLLKVASINQKIVPMLAFKQKDTEIRIKNLASLKKSLLSLSLGCIVILALSAFIFISNPMHHQTDLMGSVYSIDEVCYAVTVADEPSEKVPDAYMVTADYQLYVKKNEEWSYLGALEAYALSNEELKQATPVEVMKYSVKSITDAYRLENNNHFYWVFQTKDGKTYLAKGIKQASAVLQRLYLLESEFKGGEFNTTFFDLSLTQQLQKKVSSFWYNTSNEFEGYAIIGFTSDGTTQSDMNDLGFAVFKQSEDERFYQLLQVQVYKNAVNENQGICFKKNALTIDNRHYDIVLLANRQIDSVKRIYHYANQADVEVKEDASGGYAFLYFDLKKCDGAESYDQIYYDKNQNVLTSEHVNLEDMTMSEEEMNQLIDGVIQQELNQIFQKSYVECHDIIATELGGYADNNEEHTYRVYVVVVARDYDEKMDLLSSENFTEKCYCFEFTFEKEVYFKLSDYVVQEASEFDLVDIEEVQKRLSEACLNSIAEQMKQLV